MFTKRPTYGPLGITLSYIALGILWILFTDKLMLLIVDDPMIISFLQTLKGWMFVLITGFLLYYIINYNWRKLLASQEEAKIKNHELSIINQRLTLTENQLKVRYDELRGHEVRFRRLYSSLSSGVLIQDLSGKIIHVNDACLQLLGLSLRQLQGLDPLPNGWTYEFTEGKIKSWRELPVVASSAPTQINSEIVISTPLTNRRWLMLRTDPPIELFPNSPQSKEVFSILVDISRQKQNEIFESVLFTTNQRILSHKPLDETLTLMCKELVDSLGHLWALIAIKEPQYKVSFKYTAGVKPEHLELLKAAWDDSPLASGAVGTTIKTGRTHIVECKEEMYSLWPFLKLVNAHSIAAFPLKNDEETLGALVLLTRYPQSTESLHIAKLENFAHQVAIAMTFAKSRLDLAYGVHHDTLTELPNRILFNDRLRQATAQASRKNHLIAVLFLDIDRFKLVNDTMGHPAGDQLLKDICVRLLDCLREGDTLARQGGDEFLILLPEIQNKPEAGIVARRLLETLNSPFTIENQEVFVSGSIGIALYPFDGDSVDTLIKHADSAMYHAKDQGRNNFQFYTKQLNLSASRRLTLHNKLRKALESKELEVYYQPQINLNTGEITGIEALLRWNSPSLGMVSPAQFIPIAEETGLIVPIGEWVLKTACSMNKNWQDKGYPPKRISVNLSGRQFYQKDLVRRIASIIKETGLAPEWLELEITESIAMENLDFTAKILREIKEMGVKLSIDDFGMGFSSLNYLRRLPLDTLKIDQAFINDINPSHSGREIVNAIINLAHTLKLKVIAEGVETREQLVYLRARDCDEMQGYLFSKPIPADDMEILLAERKYLKLYSYSVK